MNFAKHKEQSTRSNCWACYLTINVHIRGKEGRGEQTRINEY